MSRMNMPPGPGRPKGLQNKITRVAKDTYWQVFEALGGLENMVAWAKANSDEFYRQFARLIPQDVNLAVDVAPEARVYPQGLPMPVTIDNESGLPSPSETVDRVH